MRSPNEVSRQFQELVLSLKRLTKSEEFRPFRKGHFELVTGVKTPFEVYIQSFIDNFDRTPKRGDVVNGSVETKKKYQSHFNILRVFAEEEGEQLSWANIDGEFCTKMKQWRSRQPAVDLHDPITMIEGQLKPQSHDGSRLFVDGFRWRTSKAFILTRISTNRSGRLLKVQYCDGC